MRMTTTLRNMVAVVLLWAGGSLAVPATVSATCWPPDQLDRIDLTNYCAGAGDACSEARSWCDYWCFATYSGHLCYNEVSFCSQHNAGGEEWPNWCIDQGYCDCYYTNS